MECRVIAILRKLFGIFLIANAMIPLLKIDFGYLPQHPKTSLHLIICLGLLCIFYENISEFNFGFLKIILKEAKAEIRAEEEKILLTIATRGAIAESNDKQAAESLFYSNPTGQFQKIAQSSEYFLKELSQKNYIKYRRTNNKTNNAVNDTKEIYEVTILKRIPA